MALWIVAFPKQFRMFVITQRFAVESMGHAEGDKAGHSDPGGDRPHLASSCFRNIKKLQFEIFKANKIGLFPEGTPSISLNVLTGL